MHAQALAMRANFAQYQLREVCAAGLIVGMKCQAPLHRYRSHQQHRKSTPKRKNMLRILIFKSVALPWSARKSIRSCNRIFGKRVHSSEAGLVFSLPNERFCWSRDSTVFIQLRMNGGLTFCFLSRLPSTRRFL